MSRLKRLIALVCLVAAAMVCGYVLGDSGTPTSADARAVRTEAAEGAAISARRAAFRAAYKTAKAGGRADAIPQARRRGRRAGLRRARRERGFPVPAYTPRARD